MLMRLTAVKIPIETLTEPEILRIRRYDDPENPRGPYLRWNGSALETDMFGQVPLFLAENRIEDSIFPGSIQHDPTYSIVPAENDIGMEFLKRPPLPQISVKEPVEELACSFRESVELRAGGKMGVLLSGGVDSSAIATLLSEYDVKAFCVADGKDRESALRLSKRLGIELVEVHIDEDEAEAAITEIYRILGMWNYVYSTPVYLPVITSLSILFFFAFREARKEGVERLFTGIGSEELFAGFTDWTGEDMEKQVIERAYTIYRRDLWRDYALAGHFGIEMEYPFLDREFASLARSIPVEMKLRDGIKKWIWRKAAERIGVPEENAWRKNRAAQYGSGADRILERLVKRSGHRYRMNYLMELLEKA